MARDLIRNRDWDYTVSGFGLPKSKHEELRNKVIRKFGEELELIAPQKPRKNKHKLRKNNAYKK